MVSISFKKTWSLQPHSQKWCYMKLSGLWKTTKAIWLGFSLSKVRVKNSNAEHMRSPRLAFRICEASEASVHKLAKARGYFEGSRQCTCFVLFENNPLTNSKWDRLAEEIVTHERDKNYCFVRIHSLLDDRFDFYQLLTWPINL